MINRSTALILLSFCFVAFLSGAATSSILNAQNESSVPSLIPTLPSISNFSFSKNLKLGDNDPDVKQLQIVLNQNKDTVVSYSGIGSTGQESSYFGRLTMSAVKRFQILNKLSPNGVVGDLTREKLNQIINPVVSNVGSSLVVQNVSQPTIQKTASTSLDFVFGKQQPFKEPLPQLYTIRPQQIRRNDNFTLVGTGFELKNTIHVGSYTFSDVSPQDSYNISFTIPSSIGNGTYEVWVENKNGSSKTNSKEIKLVITDSPKTPPFISNVSPTIVKKNESITVRGTGFTYSGNEIFSAFGTLKNLSSDGYSIIFSPKDLIQDGTDLLIPGKILKIDFYVNNDNGVSSAFGSVNVKL